MIDILLVTLLAVAPPGVARALPATGGEEFAPDPEARATAARWSEEGTSWESLRARWDAAAAPGRLRLATAAMYWPAPQAKRLLRLALDEGLAAERPELQQVYLWRAFDDGRLPTDEELAPLAGAAQRAFSRRIAAGWMPPAAAIERGLAAAPLRGVLLQALLRRPQAELAASAAPDTQGWRPMQVHAWTLHGLYFSLPAEPAPLYRAVLTDFARSSLTFGARDALETALQRQALQIPAPALRAAWQDLEQDAARARLTGIALAADPADAWSILAQVAGDPAQSLQHRVRATRRAWRSDPARASERLAGLLSPQTEASVLQTVLQALTVEATPADLARLEEILDALEGNQLKDALVVLTLHGNDAQQRLWREHFERVPRNLRSGLPRAAMHAGIAGTEELLWEWLDGEDRDLQALAARTLLDFRSGEAIARRAAGRMQRAADPAARRAIAEQLYRVRPRAALPTLASWLAGVEDLQDPLVTEVGILLVNEDAGADTFDAWWARDDLPEHPHRTLAAMSRVERDPEARLWLVERFDGMDEDWKLGVVLMTSRGAGPGDWERFGAWARDPELHHNIRRRCVAALAEGLPASSPQARACLDEERRALASGAPPSPVLQPMVMLFTEGGDEAVRAAARACVEAVEAAGHDAGGRLRAVFRGAYWRAASEEERRALMDELVQALARPLPGESPHTETPDAAAWGARFASFQEQLHKLAGAPPGALDGELAQRLEERPLAWHRDRLWLLMTTLSAWPQTGEAARAILRRSEPPGSRRVERAPEEDAAGALAARFLTEPAALQERAETLLAEGDGARAWEVATTACRRVPGDARFRNLQGWAALAAGRPEEARRSFRRAKALSGTLPDNHLLPDLGLAVLAWLDGGDRAPLEAVLARHAEARRLLRRHLPVTAMPRLAVLLEEDGDATPGAPGAAAGDEGGG